MSRIGVAVHASVQCLLCCLYVCSRHTVLSSSRLARLPCIYIQASTSLPDTCIYAHTSLMIMHTRNSIHRGQLLAAERSSRPCGLYALSGPKAALSLQRRLDVRKERGTPHSTASCLCVNFLGVCQVNPQRFFAGRVVRHRWCIRLW